jgi:hypothetical protein
LVNRSHKPGLRSASEWLYNRFPCSIGPEVCGWQRRQELLRERKLRQEWVDKNGQEWVSLNCAIFGLAVLSKKSLMAAQPLASVFGRSSNRAVQADPFSPIPKPGGQLAPATRLTQRQKREAKGAPSLPPPERAPQRQNICRGCGKPIEPGSTHCVDCAVTLSTEHLVNAAYSGRVAPHTPEAQAHRADTQSRHHAARRSWVASSQPAWLNQETYHRKIQPLLRGLSNSALALALGVSIAYAADIRAGRRRPHPRHWQVLAELVGKCEC